MVMNENLEWFVIYGPGMIPWCVSPPLTAMFIEENSAC